MSNFLLAQPAMVVIQLVNTLQPAVYRCSLGGNFLQFTTVNEISPSTLIKEAGEDNIIRI